MAVQTASAPNDQILVLPANSSVPPLDGGIALKPGQKLIGLDPFATLADADDSAPRITNSSASLNGGSAVVLSNNNEVANLVILNSWKSGILGTDVIAANVHDNQITGQNQSCTEGFRVFAFSVVVGNVTIPIPGISGGWAAIEFEYASLSNPAQINVQRNNIDDADCGDGVDVQLHNATKVTANVNANVFQNLQQGVFGDGPYNTVLGIGTQTSDNSMLTSFKLNVERSLISGNTYSNIIFDTIAPVGDLAVKVENSQLTDSPGRGIELDQTPGLTTSSAIDFGGGTLESAGNNSIFGNALDVSITNYDVFAKNDWWGSASGPSPSDIDLIGSATLEFAPFLTHAPF